MVKALRYKTAGRGFDSRWCNPSGHTMALGSTQPLTEMGTRSIFGGKGGRCVRLKTLPPSCAVVMKSGNLNSLEPSGPLQACNGTALPFIFTFTQRDTKRCLYPDIERVGVQWLSLKGDGLLHVGVIYKCVVPLLLPGLMMDHSLRLGV